MYFLWLCSPCWSQLLSMLSMIHAVPWIAYHSVITVSSVDLQTQVHTRTPPDIAVLPHTRRAVFHQAALHVDYWQNTVTIFWNTHTRHYIMLYIVSFNPLPLLTKQKWRGNNQDQDWPIWCWGKNTRGELGQYNSCWCPGSLYCQVAMVLAVYDKEVLVSHEERFQLLVSYQCHKIIENVNISICFFKTV